MLETWAEALKRGVRDALKAVIRRHRIINQYAEFWHADRATQKGFRSA
jgi:hypothetical protein